MKTLTLILLCLALTAQAQPPNQMTLVGQYVGEDYDNYFGTRAAMGDFDADGCCEFIIGAFGWNGNAGKNYFYDWNGDWPITPVWTVRGDTANDIYDLVDQNVGDINGDSIEDLAILHEAYPNPYRMDFFFGAIDFDSLPDWSMWSASGTSFGWIDSLGDVNGDGGRDLIMGAVEYGFGGQSRIYHGGDALDSIYDWRYLGRTSFDGLGDVNGDGFNDIMLMGYQVPPLLFFGGNPMDTIPDLTFYQYTYESSAAIGDVNADGYNDICLQILLPDSTYIHSYVYFGGPDMDASPDLTLLNEYGEVQGVLYVTSGDVNGDGISDLIASAYGGIGNRVLLVYLGGPWFNPVPDALVQGVASYYNWGDEMAVGDVNGDGRDEILATSSDYWFEQGLAQLFTGPETWIDYGAAVDPSDLPRTPGWFKLEQNYPNPFNSSTSIHFELGKPSRVNLRIYDLQGAQINPLIVNQQMLPGGYNVSWNGKNEGNQQVSSGIYLLELLVDQYRQMKKLVLIR